MTCRICGLEEERDGLCAGHREEWILWASGRPWAQNEDRYDWWIDARVAELTDPFAVCRSRTVGDIALTIESRGYGLAIVTRAPLIAHGLGVWDEGWWYGLRQAEQVFANWDGQGDPPDGWTRHQPSNRRRPDGDPAREYVRP